MREGAAPALLPHLSLVLALYGGAGLATAARLKWDPSTYVVLRALFPAEYRALAAALAAAAAALLALAHLALVALAAAGTATRRRLLYLYATLMCLLVAAQAAAAAWGGAAAARWLHSAQARELAAALGAGRDHLRPLLAYLAKWHPLPEHIDALIEEAMADLPCNGYVAAAAACVLVPLQLAAVALALRAARARPAQPHTRRSGSSAEQLPLKPGCGANGEPARRAHYRGGRLVIA